MSPVKKDGDDMGESRLSPGTDKKSSTDGASAQRASWVHGVRLENTEISAQEKDASEKIDASEANRVEGGDVSNIGDDDDDDDFENADSAGQIKLANQSTPADQAGSDVDFKNDSSNSDDSEIERLNANALSGAKWVELPLYSELELKALDDESRPKIGGKDAEDKLGKRVMALALLGNKRRLMALPADWSERLDRLGERFLNFKAVIDYVRTECQVASISTTRAAKLAPILLLGSPGIGKTAFAMDLAEILSGSFYMVAMENSQSGSSIGGSAKFWSNRPT